MKRLTCDILDYLGLSVEVGEGNLVNSSENEVLREIKLFSIIG